MTVKRLGIQLLPQPEKVVLRFFSPGEKERIEHIIARVFTMTDREVEEELRTVIEKFDYHHDQLEEILAKNYKKISRFIFTDREPDDRRKLFIGSLFTSEYSIEAAALFNPSIVVHPDQSNLPEDSIRFILSLRATGEGHISSLVFRQGVMHKDGSIIIEDSGQRYVIPPHIVENTQYNRELFIAQLKEQRLYNIFAEALFAEMPEIFGYRRLIEAIENLREAEALHSEEFLRTLESIEWFASFNQEVYFDPDIPMDMRIISPSIVVDLKGLEDARFVKFIDDKGIPTYYATYTAYDGRSFSPQLLATKDFNHFRFISLTGKAVKNKGFALFPKKIGGRYCMIGRQDNENITIMFSENINFWNEYRIILRPKYSWEIIQLGNCGSPIETDAGWLLFTHGVGPMRHYSMGAVLLDKEKPYKVIGRLKRPFLEAQADERSGYVPNVIYSCGALQHKDKLLIPYAMSDYITSFAEVETDELVKQILKDGN
ncbi:glycoside hydrolase family 130 protein [Spirochaetia bacterium 38H-sp]|uniref:Glycoside hydrolase family 130 protein n=1 Tax=Rarispira pelagica TaxID=3141764 RepID=A0ABU9UCE7_9SPIR